MADLYSRFLGRTSGEWAQPSETSGFRLVVASLRHMAPPPSTVTEEEIKALITEAEHVGVLETGEHRMLSGVLRLGDRPVRGLMTPRTEVDWLDIAADAHAIRARAVSTAHSLLPVGEGSPDKLIELKHRPECFSLFTKDAICGVFEVLALPAQRPTRCSKAGRAWSWACLRKKVRVSDLRVGDCCDERCLGPTSGALFARTAADRYSSDQLRVRSWPRAIAFLRCVSALEMSAATPTARWSRYDRQT